MDTKNEVQRDRLFRAMSRSYRGLEPYRKLTKCLVEEYAGSAYGQDSETKYETMLNLMNQAVDAYTMSLAANRPRINMSTPHPQLKFFARKFEIATNNLIAEIELEQVLRQAVLHAFFCVGIVKVHMADSVAVQVEENVWMDPGTPFASHISIDNWCHDMSSTKLSSVKYAADSYRIPFDDLDNSIFDQKVRKKLRPTSKIDASGDEDRLERISRGEETDEDEFEPMIDVMDVYVPRDGKVYTWAMDPRNRFQGLHEPLAGMDWDGPELGPHHLLGFNDVPQNILPSSPALHLSSLSKLANNLMRKQSRKAKRQRDVYTYEASAAAEAKRIHRTNDGEWVQAHKDSVGLLKLDGVDPSNQAFLVGVMGMFDRMAGNLSAMLGLGPQADTATQENLIHGAVNKKEAQMQYRTLDFAKRIIRDLGYMLWTDAVKSIPGRMELEGSGYEMDMTWTPEEREGDFFDYNFEIDVYSMAYQSPAQRVRSINQLITGVYAPLAPMLQQQGGIIDMQRLNEIYADLLNEPRLKEIIKFQTPTTTEEIGPEERLPEKPSISAPKEYLHKSVPTSGTQQSKDHVTQQSWMDSGQVNGDQQNQIKSF